MEKKNIFQLSEYSWHTRGPVTLTVQAEREVYFKVVVHLYKPFT